MIIYKGYKVYANGVIKNRRGRVLAQWPDKDGYMRVGLSIGGVLSQHSVHRLVAYCYCDGYEDDLVVNHKDYDRCNNNSSNLEWVTREYNLEYSAKYYTITSPDGEQFQIQNMRRFCDAHGLQSSNMIAVSKGKRAHHKGWRVVPS